MNTFWAYFKLIRVHNCLVALTAVAVGQYLTPASGHASTNPFAMAAAFFVCAFGNIINDIRDIDADRINHPHRPLPSGAISPARAKTLAFVFLLVSCLLMLKLNLISILIVIASIILVIWYNIKLKHTAYWGNLVVSILAGLTFMLGGATFGPNVLLSLPGPIIPAVFALLMHFGREIIKDIEDRAGDALTGSNTAPAKSGVTAPLILAVVVFALLIAVSLAAFLQGWFDRLYLYISLICIYIPLVAQILWLGANPNRTKCRIVSAILKLQMAAGLLALVLGRNY